jgi:GNAT superfamily N-acetyltransferase
VIVRAACKGDADSVAALHADSWRRHYRGAYSDEFLDGDVLADRLAVWRARLSEPGERDRTLLAEQDDRLVGFAHVVLAADPVWGSLLDNIHVTHERHRSGIGSRLLAEVAAAVVRHPDGEGLHLWVLEQNVAARAFYAAHGGSRIERVPVTPPGGVPGRLAGSPAKLRYAWPDAAVAARADRCGRTASR